MARCDKGGSGKPCRRARRCGICRASVRGSGPWVLRENLSMVQGMTRLVTLTAPGADVLPWDEEHCAWMGPHKHSGPLGCRIELEAAYVWATDLDSGSTGYVWPLASAAGQRAGRVCAGLGGSELRGATLPHGHDRRTRRGIVSWRRCWSSRPLTGSGRTHDKGYAARGGYAHAAYLSKYVTKDGHDEIATRVALRGLAASAATVWVSPVLTSDRERL